MAYLTFGLLIWLVLSSLLAVFIHAAKQDIGPAAINVIVMFASIFSALWFFNKVM